MSLILFSYLISGCNYSNKFNRNCRRYSDEIWATIPAGQKDMFNQLSDEDSTTTYALAYKDWGDSVSRDMDNAEPDEKLLNMATSAKHLYLNDSGFNKTSFLFLVCAKYYKNRYIETQDHEYLDRILVIAYQVRQNREYPPAPIAELRTLFYFLQSLVTSSKKKLTEMGYNKKEMEILLKEMQEKYRELWD